MFICCRDGCPSDAVNVHALNYVNALNEERRRRPVQYWERCLGVSTPNFPLHYHLGCTARRGTPL